MKKLILVLFAVFLFLFSLLNADPGVENDILIKMKFYEGIRKAGVKTHSIVSTYFLKPLFVGNISFSPSGTDEAKDIKKIFNLSAIKLMSEAKWGWRSDEKKKEFQILILNGHEFLVEIIMLNEKGLFGISVKNKDNDKVLLKTALILPEKKSSVFGFEDSLEKPFFLSLNRAKGESVIRKEKDLKKAVSVKDPVLIKKVKPVYPKEALKKKISGVVVIEAVSDIYGQIKSARILKGDLLLGKAALKAVSKWVYEPYIIDGVPKPVKFTVIVKFRLSKDKKKISPGKTGKNVPDIWPTKGYLTSGFGMRVHPITGKKKHHDGQDIAAKKGSLVVAAASGIVTFAGIKGAYGKLVIIDHGNGYISKYGQLSEIKVKKGDKIKKRDRIGLVGESGQSTAPHLHWEVHYKGKPINPLDLLKE